MNTENSPIYTEIGIIAGRGVYPHVLAASARKQGVKKIFAVAFRGETRKDINQLADEVNWLYVGQLKKFLRVIEASGIKHFVMVGQIAPKNLFHARPDASMLQLIKRLDALNAHTLFGAIGDELANIGVTLLPAHAFMASAMPSEGILTDRKPTVQEQRDIDLGIETATLISALDIGQTVVVKEGVILAVEAFEGTDKAILRAGKLGGAGGVVVKVAKGEHDMRFDIPVIGMRTMKSFKKAKISALAVDAGRCIFLEKEKVLARANAMNMAVVAVVTGGESVKMG